MVSEIKYNILIVDDDQELLDLLKKFLERNYYHVYSARDGEEGLFMMEQYQIDIVICDVLMPRLNGIEFVKKAKNKNKNIEIIMMSGHPISGERTCHMQGAISQYFTKPFEREALLEGIHRASCCLD